MLSNNDFAAFQVVISSRLRLTETSEQSHEILDRTAH